MWRLHSPSNNSDTASHRQKASEQPHNTLLRFRLRTEDSETLDGMSHLLGGNTKYICFPTPGVLWNKSKPMYVYVLYASSDHSLNIHLQKISLHVRTWSTWDVSCWVGQHYCTTVGLVLELLEVYIRYPSLTELPPGLHLHPSANKKMEQKLRFLIMTDLDPPVTPDTIPKANHLRTWNQRRPKMRENFTTKLKT